MIGVRPVHAVQKWISRRRPLRKQPMQDPAIVVQCFNKPDTLLLLLDSLLRCEGHEKFHLWLWIDRVKGSLREEEFRAGWAQVRQVCADFKNQYFHKFKTIQIEENDSNCGPYKTCQRAIDAATHSSTYVIFTEDDAIFATDALLWFEQALTEGFLADESNWAIAGESIYFDARKNSVDEAFTRSAVEFVQSGRYCNKYVKFKFLPSTCFSTTATRWREFGETRGLKNGDIDVNTRCVNEGKFCIFPVVPRVKDTGMLHPAGWSVSIHGASDVAAVRNTYLMSDMAGCSPSALPLAALPASEAGPLFDASVNLRGFSLADERSDSRARARSIDNLIMDARSVAAEKGLEESLPIWEEIRALFPEHPAGHVGAGEALREAGRFEEADQILSQTVIRFPNYSWALIHYATVATRREDWHEALRRWKDAQDRFRDEPAVLAGLGETLRKAGRFDEADQVLADAITRFPAHPWVALHYAMVATERQDWAEAQQRWRLVRERFPDLPAAASYEREALRHLEKQTMAETKAAV